MREVSETNTLKYGHWKGVSHAKKNHPEGDPGGDIGKGQIWATGRSTCPAIWHK